MPPKVSKDAKGKVFFKVGAQVKDVIPVSCKNPSRDQRVYKFPEGVQPPQKVAEFEPLADPEEWPGEEAVKAMDFGMDAGKLFVDGFNEWPSELCLGQRVITWRRPREYLRETYMKEENWSAPRLLPSSDPVAPSMLYKEDTYSTKQESTKEILEMTRKAEELICVCESFEREETQDENERRRKEQIERITQQQAKEKKKPSKRPEELVEEGLIKVRDVRLSNINMNIDNLGPDSLWVGSQLQFIKDRDVRDVYSNRPLWSKIYPQVDGAPIYNPSGRYWVRLYYMGRERRVEVDDRMPSNIDRPLLPQSAIPTQLWTMLVCKAVFKLLSFQRSLQSQRPVYGDGFVVYSLTGMLSEILDIKDMPLDTLNRKDALITVFNTVGRQPQVELTPQEKRQSKILQQEQIRNIGKINDNIDRDDAYTMMVKNNSAQFEEQDEQHEDDHNDVMKQLDCSLSKYKRRRSAQEIMQVDRVLETNVLNGYTYSVIEQFTNEAFNMVYVQKRTDREMRLRSEYYEICKANIHKMSKEEKLEHRRRKKEVRERLNEEDQRRIQLITQTILYKLLRVKSGAMGTKAIRVQCQFSAEEIFIAKKCIANKLSKPPNYDVPEIRGDDKSMQSSQQKMQMHPQDDTFQVKPLLDFSSLATAVEPIRKEPGGFWVMDKDFNNLFKNVQIFYNPLKWQYNQVLQQTANIDNEVATYEPMEILIVERNPQMDDTAAVSLLVGFQAKYAQNENIESTLKPFAVLQRFDMESFESARDYRVLDKYVCGQMIPLDNKNHIFRLNIFSPLAYTLWTTSTNSVKMMSIYDYLSEFEGYKGKSFSIDYPSLLGKKYFTFFRFKVQLMDKDTSSFVFRMRSQNDNYMFKSMRLKLCEVPVPEEGQETPTYMLQTLEGVHKNLYETLYIIQGTQRIPIRSGVVYYFILEGQTSYPIQEGTLELDFIANPNSTVNIDLLEQVEPVKYIDKYIPTKYGVIFRGSGN